MRKNLGKVTKKMIFCVFFSPAKYFKAAKIPFQETTKRQSTEKPTTCQVLLVEHQISAGTGIREYSKIVVGSMAEKFCIKIKKTRNFAAFFSVVQ